MAKLEWRAELCVGVDFLDDQHQAIYRAINDFDDALEQGLKKHQIMDVFAKLMEYINTHFKNEEEYMRQTKYPHYDAHLKQHHMFREEIARLWKRFLADEVDIGQKLLFYISSWLPNHIRGSDSDYAEK